VGRYFQFLLHVGSSSELLDEYQSLESSVINKIHHENTMTDETKAKEKEIQNMSANNIHMTCKAPLDIVLAYKNLAFPLSTFMLQYSGQYFLKLLASILIRR
jgi:hypothetical protein